MIKYLKKFKIGGYEDLQTPKEETITFNLMYKDLLVGTLELEGGWWRFRYSAAFKNQDNLKPLPDFPNLEKVYNSEDLYPFFLHRIPSTKQPKVRAVIKEKNVDETNKVALLKLFGFRSITNPFTLSPAYAG